MAGLLAPPVAASAVTATTETAQEEARWAWAPRPVASWALSDAEGETQAEGADGAGPATAGPGVTFGVEGPYSPLRSAARLDGTDAAYLDTGAHVVDTDTSFTVAAWALLPEAPSSTVVMVSQNGGGEPGFTLGVDGDTGRYSFAMPDLEIGSMKWWKALGPRPAAGEWAHLVGVYSAWEDGQPGRLRLYVNGRLTGEAQQSWPAWNATGALQIGRATTPRTYGHLDGSIADVEVFDSALSLDEVADVHRAPVRQRAYWHMEGESGGVMPDLEGGEGLALHGDAAAYVPDRSCDLGTDPSCEPVREPLWGEGHLDLHGNGYASRGPGLLRADGGFTVTARVRMDAHCPPGDRTVFSLPGATRNAAVVRYDAERCVWSFEVRDADEDAAPSTRVVAAGGVPARDGFGDHLALAYDPVLGEVALYLNGEKATESVEWHPEWDFSTVGVDVGRTGGASTAADFFSGEVDEVRVFDGALDQDAIIAVSALHSGAELDPDGPDIG